MAASVTATEDGPLPVLSSMSETTASKNAQASQSTEAVEDIVFGSVAGAIGKVFEYPFDTVKVRLQSHGTSVYKNTLDCFQQAIRSDGVVRGLYRGLSAPIVGAAFETSSLFFSYRISQDIFLSSVYQAHKTREDLPMDALFLAGAISGAFTSLWLTPIELVKCQMQAPLAPGSVHGPGVFVVIGNVFRHNGPLGFWHGQLGTLIREAGGSAAWFGAYEGAKKLFKNRNLRRQVSISNQDEPQLHITQLLVAGASAGVAYNFAFFPADTIKSRMQTEEVGPERAVTPKPDKLGTGALSKAQRKPNFWNTGKAIWREAGLRGMYRGCGITVARSTLSSPIIFGIYETLKASRHS